METNIIMKNPFVEFVLSPKFYVPIIAIIGGLLLMIIAKLIIRKIIISDATSIEAKKRNTIVILFNNLLKYLIIIIVLLVILSVYGVNITGFLTGLGVAGIVAGLALQDALKDIIAGINIIMDNYYVVGDMVEYKGFVGNVVEFGLKSTKIRGLDGKTLIVANHEITSIYNLSLKDKELFLTYPVAYEEDIDKVSDIFNKLTKKLEKEDKIISAELLGVNELNNSSVDYMLAVKCEAKNQYRIKRMVNELVKKELDKNKVKIPYPQVEVHNGK